MKDRIKIFLDKDTLESIIINDDAFKNMLTIISEHSVVYLNNPEEEIDKDWTSSSLDGQRGGSVIHKFQIGHPMKRPVSACEQFSQFYQDHKSLLEFSRSVFILDITQEKAEELRTSLGLMVQSKNSLSDNIFQFHIKDTVSKKEVKDGHKDGWDFFFGLRRHPWLPSNVLIFSDEYLFKNEVRGENLGVRNLKSILLNLLPKKLETEFQILVVSPIPKNNRFKAQKISDELTEFVHGLPLQYDCTITFVFTDAIHTRKAISNYYVMTCDKGFCVYSCNPMNQVHDTNFVDITSDFHSASDSSGTNGYDDTSLCLSELKKHCEEAQVQARAGIQTVLISGDCGPNFEIFNRLLQAAN